MLATYPDPSVRNGHEAIELAAGALERSAVKGSALWDTLAAAYAEAGQFADAVLTAQRALRAAQQQSRPDLVKAIQRRTRLYETGMPFREAAPLLSTDPNSKHVLGKDANSDALSFLAVVRGTRAQPWRR